MVMGKHLAPQIKRQLEREREWYEDARHMLTVLGRARPKLERVKGNFILTINNGPEHSSLILDGSGNFVGGNFNG